MLQIWPAMLIGGARLCVHLVIDSRRGLGMVQARARLMVKRRHSWLMIHGKRLLSWIRVVLHQADLLVGHIRAHITILRLVHQRRRRRIIVGVWANHGGLLICCCRCCCLAGRGVGAERMVLFRC